MMKRKYLYLTYGLLFTLQLLFSQSLWNDNGEIFTDLKLYPNGTVIHVLFDNAITANFTSSFAAEIKNENKSPKIKGDILDFLPSLELSKERKSDEKTTFAWNEEFQTSLAVEIIGVDIPSATYRVRGRHTVRIGNQVEGFELTSKIAHRDVSSDRAINSKKLLDAQISFSGITITAGTTLRETELASTGLKKMQTNIEGKASLSEEKQKEILFRYLSRFLNELF